MIADPGPEPWETPEEAEQEARAARAEQDRERLDVPGRDDVDIPSGETT